MTSFEVLRKWHLVTLSKICLWLRPCAYLCGQKWINRIFSKLARAISKILFILGSHDFLSYLECIRSYAWSKGHSETDLGSVPVLKFLNENLLDGILKAGKFKLELFLNLKSKNGVKFQKRFCTVPPEPAPEPALSPPA